VDRTVAGAASPRRRGGASATTPSTCLSKRFPNPRCGPAVPIRDAGDMEERLRKPPPAAPKRLLDMVALPTEAQRRVVRPTSSPGRAPQTAREIAEGRRPRRRDRTDVDVRSPFGSSWAIPEACPVPLRSPLRLGHAPVKRPPLGTPKGGPRTSPCGSHASPIASRTASNPATSTRPRSASHSSSFSLGGGSRAGSGGLALWQRPGSLEEHGVSIQMRGDIGVHRDPLVVKARDSSKPLLMRALGAAIPVTERVPTRRPDYSGQRRDACPRVSGTLAPRRARCPEPPKSL
jgi:hypothetical protein